MAQEGLVQGAAALPASEFRFSVEISGVGKVSCKEVSGLDVELDEIEYRSGGMPGFTKAKMPGLKKSGEVTLKKAMFKDDKNLWDWLDQMRTNVVERADVTIALLDESGSPVQSWKLNDARPKRYTVDGFKDDGGSVSMETIVIAHEGAAPA